MLPQLLAHHQVNWHQNMHRGKHTVRSGPAAPHRVQQTWELWPKPVLEGSHRPLRPRAQAATTRPCRPASDTVRRYPLVVQQPKAADRGDDQACTRSATLHVMLPIIGTGGQQHACSRTCKGAARARKVSVADVHVPACTRPLVSMAWRAVHCMLTGVQTAYKEEQASGRAGHASGW